MVSNTFLCFYLIISHTLIRSAGSHTQVLPTDELITARSFDETFLFQWGEQNISGDWRSLESVAKPNKYLCVERKGKVTITEEQIPDFCISYSDEKKGNVCERNIVLCE